MRLIRWWHGWWSFGFAFYLNPDRNPTLAFTKAGGLYLSIGRWSYYRQSR